MVEPSPGTTPTIKMAEDRLDSWKEIAAYLDRDVTTVQRWEKRRECGSIAISMIAWARFTHSRPNSIFGRKNAFKGWKENGAQR